MKSTEKDENPYQPPESKEERKGRVASTAHVLGKLSFEILVALVILLSILMPLIFG